MPPVQPFLSITNEGRRARNELTLAEKVRLIRFSAATRKGHRQIGEEFKIGKTQVGTILKNKQKILDRFRSSGPSFRSRKRGRCDKSLISNGEVDRQVHRWVQECDARGTAVKGFLIKKQALKVAKSMGVKDFKASTGWITRFCRRFDISLNERRRDVSHCVPAKYAKSTSVSNDISHLSPKSEEDLNKINDSCSDDQSGGASDSHSEDQMIENSTEQEVQYNLDADNCDADDVDLAAHRQPNM